MYERERARERERERERAISLNFKMAAVMCNNCNLKSSMPHEETFLLGSSPYQLHAGFLLDLIFDLEDRRDMFLRNVG
jgi:hypothetical protein